VRFIQNEITEESASNLLRRQVDERRANRYFRENEGSWVRAHRDWLQGFVGNHILPSAFACAGDFLKNIQLEEDEARLLDITANMEV